MAKYEPIEMVKSYSGKICEHSDVYFAKKGKTLYTGKICNPRTKPFSAEELARQEKFAARVHVRNGIREVGRVSATLGADAPMSGFNPDAINEEKSGMASRAKKEESGIQCRVNKQSQQPSNPKP